MREAEGTNIFEWYKRYALGDREGMGCRSQAASAAMQAYAGV